MINMFSKRMIIVFALPFILLSSCGQKPADVTVKEEAGEVKTIDPSTIQGTNISGTVNFSGTPPESKKIKMGGNPECAFHNVTDAGDVLINNGKVQNAFVYIKEGLRIEESYAIPSEPVVMENKRCLYEPRVIGVQAGQPIQLLNSDPTLHNIHAMTKINKAFNIGLPVAGSKAVKKFDRQEVMVSMKCDLHSWMQGWIGVVAHPYFAVTDVEGHFELKNVPKGNYTLEIWHERLGTFTQTVEVTDSPTDLTLNFPAPSAS